MTAHDQHEDLGARLRATASAVEVAPASPGDVVVRGRQRQARRRGGAAAGAAGLVLAGVLALPSLQPGPTPGPVILDDPAPTPSSAPSPSPSPSVSETTEPRPAIFADEWDWEVVRYGDDGIFAPAARGHTVLQEGDAGPVIRALPLSDGSVANQVEDGTIRIARDPQVGEGLVLETTGTSVRLLAHRQTSGELWWSGRLPGGEGDEEHLFVHDLATGATRDAGVSAGVESFTDELAFSEASDSVAWLGCHLQCTLYVGTIEELFARNASILPQDVAAGWLYGLAISPDGQWVASVDSPDPGLPGDRVNPSQVVLWDARGNEISRVDLPRHLVHGAPRVEFTPDGASILVGDAAGAWVLNGVEGGEPPRELLAPNGPIASGAAMTGRDRRTVPMGDDASAVSQDEILGWYASVTWPMAGHRAWAWSTDEGADDRPWQTSASNVVQSFLVAAGVASESEAVTMVDVASVPGGESRTYEVGPADRHAVLRVTVARYGDDPHWWVLGNVGEGDGMVSTFQRQGVDLQLGGSLPPDATTIEVAALDAPTWTAVIDEEAWSWQATITGPWGAEPLSLLLRVKDEDGLVVGLDSFVFPGEDSAAG